MMSVMVLTGRLDAIDAKVVWQKWEGVLQLLVGQREREEVRARCPSGRRGVCPTGRAAGVLLKLMLWLVWEMMPNRAHRVRTSGADALRLCGSRSRSDPALACVHQGAAVQRALLRRSCT